MTGQPAAIPAALRRLALPALVLVAGAGFSDGRTAALIADRTAIERVYYNHRAGAGPPFEQAVPPSFIQQLVQDELHKEAVLGQAYHVVITAPQIEAEVQRINTTTRAPEMLAEIKAALGHDPARFARALARPILVERELRQRFDNDDALHAATRRECGSVRERLLSIRGSRGNEAPTAKSEIGNQKSEMDPSLLTSAATDGLAGKLLGLLKQTHSNEVSETTWQLGPRPAETNAPAADELEIKQRFGPDAQLLSPPHAGLDKERKFYFEDLPAELQKVLRVQLRRAGDVSAVIETPGAFQLYLAREKTSEALSVAVLSLRKRDFERWLAEQAEGEP